MIAGPNGVRGYRTSERCFDALAPPPNQAQTLLVPAMGGFVRFIFVALFFFLLIAWVCGFVLFHVAGGMIHLLLLFAFISLIIHFVAGRRIA